MSWLNTRNELPSPPPREAKMWFGYLLAGFVRESGYSAGISAWQWAQLVGGSTSASVPHAGQTRRSQQAGSPGRSSAAAERALVASRR
jgi:hypothetical protein